MGAGSLTVAIAAVPVVREVTANVIAIERAIDFASNAGADILLTPEGSLSGYYDGFDAIEVADALRHVTAKAREAKLGLALGTCFEEADGQRYNQLRFYDESGELLGFHAKILLCKRTREPELLGESDQFATAPLMSFQLKGITVGGLICNDMWANPEWTPGADPFLARQLAHLGAKVIFLAINSGVGEGEELALNRSFHEVNMRLRARASGVWIVAADAADPHGKLQSNAPSGIIGPNGDWVHRASSEVMLIGSLTPF